MKSREKTRGWRAMVEAGEQAPFDVAAQFRDDGGELLVFRLLLEDDERRDDVQPRLDHRRELAREDLERLGLDLLDREGLALDSGRPLLEPDRQEPADAQCLPSGARVRRGDLTDRFETGRVDGRIRKRRHVAGNRQPPLFA